MKTHLVAAAAAFAMALVLGATGRPLVAGQCTDFSKDPAGCQPSTFDTPIGDMPSVRIGRTGNLDPKSSEADARAGAALLEKNLHLFRNMEHLHWVITVPSWQDEATGIDMNTCLPLAHSEPTDYNIQPHEFFLWHDPANANRILAYVTNWTGGVPDAEHPGLKIPDALVMAMTDEKTGEMLPKAKFLAGFSLQEVGGPPINEKPDATGLFSDGRFLEFSVLKNRSIRGGNFQNQAQNRLHSLSISADGERVLA